MSGKTVGNLAWIAAMMDAREGDMRYVGELLENEAFEFSMSERRDLADLIAKPKKTGHKGNTVRDLDLYREVLSHKLSNGIKKLPDAELLRIAEPYGLRATETIRSALKNGKRLSKMLAQIDAENEPQEGND